MNYLSDEEILARTILREGGERGKRTYDSIAWLIYNRFQNKPKFGENFKDICLRIGQFETWSPFWGIENIPIDDVDSEIKNHQDYDYCLNLSKLLLDDKRPSEFDLTNGAVFYSCMSLDPKCKHPNGIEIDQHWFYK